MLINIYIYGISLICFGYPTQWEMKLIDRSDTIGYLNNYALVSTAATLYMEIYNFQRPVQDETSE